MEPRALPEPLRRDLLRSLVATPRDRGRVIGELVERNPLNGRAADRSGDVGTTLSIVVAASSNDSLVGVAKDYASEPKGVSRPLRTVERPQVERVAGGRSYLLRGSLPATQVRRATGA